MGHLRLCKQKNIKTGLLRDETFLCFCEKVKSSLKIDSEFEVVKVTHHQIWMLVPVVPNYAIQETVKNGGGCE